MSASLLSKALNGARLLDEKVPGWRRKIRRRKLDMELGYRDTPDECGCILAQLFPSYSSGLTVLNITAPVRNGFSIGHNWAIDDERWQKLTEAWLKILREDLR